MPQLLRGWTSVVFWHKLASFHHQRLQGASTQKAGRARVQCQTVRPTDRPRPTPVSQTSGAASATTSRLPQKKKAILRRRRSKWRFRSIILRLIGRTMEDDCDEEDEVRVIPDGRREGRGRFPFITVNKAVGRRGRVIVL